MVYGPHVAVICQVCISQRTGLYQWNHSPQNFLATTLLSLEEYICISKTSSPAKNLQHFSNNSLFQEQSTTYLCKIIKFWYTVCTLPLVLLFILWVSIRGRLVYTLYTNVHHTNSNTEYIAEFSSKQIVKCV